MYNEIIKKVEPYLKTLIDEHFHHLIYAYNLHIYECEENGVEGDYIFYSLNKGNVKKALDIMGEKNFYQTIRKSERDDFYFDNTGEIFSETKIKNILFDNFDYYMYETLAEPWHSTETQELYREIWDIAANNKYGVK